jgi:hypothetical protein
MSALALSADERIAHKPFTHPAYSKVEARVLRYMLLRLCQVVETFASNSTSELSIKEMLEPDGRYHRVIVIQAAELAARTSFSVVGFFGQRCFDADYQDADARDKMLFEEMAVHPGLCSYSTLELTNGDYGNCVLFKDEASKNAWGRSQVHDSAVKELSPRFYHSIRLYNASLNAPLFEPHKLRLEQVRYFDYGVTPVWTAVRKLH